MGILKVRIDGICQYKNGRREGAPALKMMEMTDKRVPLCHFWGKEPINTHFKAVCWAPREAPRSPSTIIAYEGLRIYPEDKRKGKEELITDWEWQEWQVHFSYLVTIYLESPLRQVLLLCHFIYSSQSHEAADICCFLPKETKAQ